MAAPSTAQGLPVRLDAPAGAAHERRLPVEGTLAALLPEGSIRQGTAVAVGGHGSMTLATALAAEASRRGSWVAAVGMADLGVAALAERGVDLDRWALVDLPEEERNRNTAADVLGAVVDGFDLVLLGSGIRVAGSTARRLLARMREHGTSLIFALGSAPTDGAAGLQPEVRLTIEQARWTGIDDGHGRLLARRAEVTVTGQGAASRPRRMLMWLPSQDGRVACEGLDQASTVADGPEAERIGARIQPIRARPWPERSVSAANKSGNDTATSQPALTYPRGPVGDVTQRRAG